MQLSTYLFVHSSGVLIYLAGDHVFVVIGFKASDTNQRTLPTFLFEKFKGKL
jgi:hypothetical protein